MYTEKEELKRMPVHRLKEQLLYIPNHNDRYLNHLENLATDPKPSTIKQNAINTLVKLIHDTEYNRMIQDMIIIKRNTVSIFA